MKKKSESKSFIKVKGTPHLYTRAGIYYYRRKVNGQLIAASLETTDKPTAIRKLTKELNRSHTKTFDRLRGGEAIKLQLSLFAKKYSADRLDHLERTTKRILKTWPAFERRVVADISRSELELWEARLKRAKAKPPPGTRQRSKPYSPSSINKTLVCMRGLFDLIVDRSECDTNRARQVLRNVRERPKDLDLPTRAQVKELLNLLRTNRGYRYSFGNAAADQVELMINSGMRPGEALNATWQDDHGDYFYVRGTKSDAAHRKVPMFPGLRALLDRLNRMDGRILRRNCKRTIQNGLKEIGAPAITLQGWRHWFITECITETEVPFAVLASWVGHSDGGILLAKTYSHLRESTSSRWAKKIEFKESDS